MNKSLTGEEILNAIGEDKCKIMLYNMLDDIDNIDDVFIGDDGSQKRFVALLYIFKETSDGIYGHWTLLTKYPKKISFFDSYGLLIDTERKFIPANIKKSYSENFPKLADLLSSQKKYKIEYNDHQFQKFSNNITTCGRWIIARAWLWKTSLEEFEKLFEPINGYSSDDIVVQFTKKYLNY